MMQSRWAKRYAYWMLAFSGSTTCPMLDAIEVPLFSDFRADYEIRQGTELDWREIELAFRERQTSTHRAGKRPMRSRACWSRFASGGR
jgi:hypothetical protein